MTELRELLFGDVPIETWAGTSNEKPWTHFQDAEHAMARADVPAAEAALHAVLDTADLESRQYLQAWSCLRQLDRDALTALPERLYGVVLDVPLEQGYDTLAAYDDHTARYLNQAGGAIIWHAEDAAMDALVDALLAAARPAAHHGRRVGERTPSAHRGTCQDQPAHRGGAALHRGSLRGA